MWDYGFLMANGEIALVAPWHWPNPGTISPTALDASDVLLLDQGK
jgi:hypothetical protein